jgi:hypothetical protein
VYAVAPLVGFPACASALVVPPAAMANMAHSNVRKLNNF